MTAREDTVLAPTDPSVTDENDWWEFSLTDVKVLRPGKMLYANLLDASDDNPLQVIGCLEQVREDEEHLVLNPDYLSKRIVIDDVTHYAYGQTEDKTIEIWVAGKAGWYDISPAKGYLPTFNRMVQSIDLLYFLVDRHKQGRRQLKPTVRELCEQVSRVFVCCLARPLTPSQYIYHTHGVCEDRAQSAEVFKDHGPFLLRCMIRDEEEVQWKKTNIFNHLRRQCRAYDQIMEEVSSSSADEAQDEPEVSTPRHDPAAIAKSQTYAIYQLLKELRDEGQLAKRRLHIDLLQERLASRYSLTDKDGAQKIIAARATAVLELMDAEEGFRWHRYVIHRELKQAASKHTPLPPALLTPLLALEPSSDEDSGRVRKSVLRPKATSKKLMGKRNKDAAANQEAKESDADDDEEDAPDEMNTPSKTRGHELIRDPFSSAKPRTRSILSDTGPAASLMKRLLQDTVQTPTTPILSDTNNGTSDLSSLPTTGDSELESDDVWTCHMPECTKTIVMKAGDERKKLVEAHATEHDWKTQMRVELVESERRLHSAFPVTNLMQYLVNQHYQQMRTAFPELYEGDNQRNGNGTIEHALSPSDNGDAETTPKSQRSSAKKQKLTPADVNGHT
ncbi:hypothetical protein N7474_000933 [Penicillium riverlandense]|uniref:uncharacterized protein n=1 Tax=Penicillium riverlandense TaxID=1903569 RepID=UPI0025475046|nr:uncharacterized protein N7474_000933 [Penicillium riverlandense]KAJ5832622.1 hypothetical protein N7474_000933 [Penicillium riverlandense]